MARGPPRGCAGGRTWCVFFLEEGGWGAEKEEAHTSTHTLPPHTQTLIYAGQPLDNDKQLADYGVPPVRACMCVCFGRDAAAAALLLSHPSPPFPSLPQGCQALIAIETARLTAPHDADSPFWG